METMETLVEQRNELRTNLEWPVSLWHPESNRFFNGQSSNVSKTGVYMRLPVTTPVQKGQSVELNFPRTEMLAEQKGQYARIKSGRIIRVDRSDMLRRADIGVAVEFDSGVN
jgi:hypothetical protein